MENIQNKFQIILNTTQFENSKEIFLEAEKSGIKDVCNAFLLFLKFWINSDKIIRKGGQYIKEKQKSKNDYSQIEKFKKRQIIGPIKSTIELNNDEKIIPAYFKLDLSNEKYNNLYEFIEDTNLVESYELELIDEDLQNDKKFKSPFENIYRFVNDDVYFQSPYMLKSPNYKCKDGKIGESKNQSKHLLKYFLVNFNEVKKRKVKCYYSEKKSNSGYEALTNLEGNVPQNVTELQEIYIKDLEEFELEFKNIDNSDINSHDRYFFTNCFVFQSFGDTDFLLNDTSLNSKKGGVYINFGARFYIPLDKNTMLKTSKRKEKLDYKNTQ